MVPKILHRHIGGKTKYQMVGHNIKHMDYHTHSKKTKN